MLGRHVAQARQIIVKLLVGRLTFEPETRDGRRGFRFHAVGTVAKLIAGVVPGEVSCLQAVASLSIPSWNRLHGWLQDMDLLWKAT